MRSKPGDPQRSLAPTPDPFAANAWQPPTADSFEFARVKVAHRGEQTCVVCGDVAIDGRCIHCGKVLRDGSVIGGKRLVHTLDYLKEDEVIIG